MSIYQLDDINNFKLLLKENQTLEKFFLFNKFDNSVLAYDNHVVQPGSKKILRYDRAKGARWVVIIAAYFVYFDIQQIHKVFKIEIANPQTSLDYEILDISINFNKHSFNAEKILNKNSFRKTLDTIKQKREE